MSGIIRKSLLIKYQPSDRSCVEKSFTILKYDYSSYSAKFELQVPAFTTNKTLDLLLYNGIRSESYTFSRKAKEKEEFRFAVGYPVCDGVSVAVFDKADGTPLFYGSNLKDYTLREMIKLYEKNYKKHDESDDKTEKPIFSTEKSDAISEKSYGEKQSDLTDSEIGLKANFEKQACEYDDEAVAVENYYETIDFEPPCKIDETKPDEVKNDDVYNAPFDTEQNVEDRSEQTQSDGNAEQNDKDLRACPFNKTLPRFYEEKRDEIENLFDKYPPISSLSQYIPESKWVKIDYKKDGYYIIGVIKKDNVPQYIVYGVPGNRAVHPRGFEKYSVFLPESLFDTNGRGFWCSFQDAESGKIQNPEKT